MSQEKEKKITRTMIQAIVSLIFDNNSDSQSATGYPQFDSFEEKITSSLPEEFFNRDDIPEHLSKLCDISGISKSETLKSVIKNKKVELGLLVTIKDYFKELSGKTSEKTEHQIYNAIYYAIIACALLYHHKRISSYSYDKLAKNYARLLKEVWLPNYILKLYEQTQHYCVEKAKK